MKAELEIVIDCSGVTAITAGMLRNSIALATVESALDYLLDELAQGRADGSAAMATEILITSEQLLLEERRSIRSDELGRDVLPPRIPRGELCRRPLL